MKSQKKISVATLLSLLVLTGCTNNTPVKVETTPVAPVSQDTPVKPEVSVSPEVPVKPEVSVLPEVPTKTDAIPTAKVTNTPATPADVTKIEEISYTSPAGTESIKISITSKDGTITDVSATPLATHPISLKLQTAFADGVSKNVVGKTLKGLKVDTISGASLTTGAFNKLLASSN